MPQLLTPTLIFGTGMTFIGPSPGALYGMAPAGGYEKCKVQGSLCAASMVISTPNIRIEAEETGG